MKPCRYCAEEIQDAAILCRFCNRHQAPPREQSEHGILNAVLALFVVIAVGGGGFLLGQNTLGAAAAAESATSKLVAGASADTATEEKPAPRRPPPPPPPSRFTLMDARTAQLDGGQYMVYTFDLRNWACSLRGYVGVSAGGSRDVDLYLVNEAGFSMFKQGTQFDTYFARSRTTGENLDLQLPPDVYYLIVSNRFSWLTGKTVEIGSMAAECSDAQVVVAGYGSEGDI